MHGPDGTTMDSKLHLVRVVGKGKNGKLACSAARPCMFLPPPVAAPTAPAKK
jgi:hypothetical protein